MQTSTIVFKAEPADYSASSSGGIVSSTSSSSSAVVLGNMRPPPPPPPPKVKVIDVKLEEPTSSIPDLAAADSSVKGRGTAVAMPTPQSRGIQTAVAEHAPAVDVVRGASAQGGQRPRQPEKKDKEKSISIVGTCSIDNDKDFSGGEPMLWLYVGHCKPQTTADKVKSYLEKKSAGHNFEVTELNSVGRFKSFKVAVLAAMAMPGILGYWDHVTDTQISKPEICRDSGFAGRGKAINGKFVFSFGERASFYVMVDARFEYLATANNYLI
ncbi:unnamed protein product [Phaedon cochleariae]|uniref:Uncharacterized protein n=1 Tax=Phaedon cochleariae TaxID=80249 RepID=A0A9N9SH95_PHACE|nr:unnamed protein product [Phaedon cochleariae]